MTEIQEPKSGKNQNPQSPPMPLWPAFDPVALAAETERAVCQGNKRKYLKFVNTINYKGIAEGYPVGCCLRCIFCWAIETPDQCMQEVTYYSPQEVYDRLSAIARKKKLHQLGLSHAEATIGKSHLLELLELVERSDFKRFVIETNGILLGLDRAYARDLAAFKKVWVRVSIKAGTPEAFTRKTGAIAEAFEYPFQALQYLKDEAIDFGVAAMSADPRFMDPLERVSLIGKLAAIDPRLVLNLEEEMVVLYANTFKRLKAMGWNYPRHQLHLIQKLPFLKNILQVSYCRISSLAQKKLDRGFTRKAIKELFLYYKI
jgi:uncharacterized Fe-S cluster-containing radical SAM superfamily protein